MRAEGEGDVLMHTPDGPGLLNVAYPICLALTTAAWYAFGSEARSISGNTFTSETTLYLGWIPQTLQKSRNPLKQVHTL